MLSTQSIGQFRYGLASVEELDRVRRFHHDRYLGVGYIEKPTPTGMIEDDFVGFSSYFFAQRASDDEVVGVIRQIQSSFCGLPALNEFEVDPHWIDIISSYEHKQIVEIGSLAVLPGHPKCVKGLYRSIWQRSRTEGHKVWVAAIDSRLLRSFSMMRGFHWTSIGNPMFYMGSETVPVAAIVDDQARNMRKKFPDFFRYLDSPEVDPT